jgi:parvulin-like peptidyl-prolyl isomerase
MLKWFWDNGSSKVINSNLQSYSIDYVGNLFTDKVKSKVLKYDGLIEMSKENAFKQLIDSFELDLEFKEFKIEKLLIDTKNENIKMLLNLKDRAKCVR